MNPKLKINGSWTQFLEPIRHLEPFDTSTGSLFGVLLPAGMLSRPHPGRLSEEWIGDLKRPDVDYVIVSYQTPIAWHHSTDDEWVMPEDRYSTSTSKHQGRIRTALSVRKDTSYI